MKVFLAFVFVVCVRAEQNGYEYSNQTGHWYKFHSKVVNWTTARRICEEDGARLAVPNSIEEAKVLTTIHARYLDSEIPGTDWPDWVAVGIYWQDNAWVTVDGASLANAGYEKWMQGWPSKMNAYPYVVMDRGGKFSNTNSVLYPFICEKASTIKSNDKLENDGCGAAGVKPALTPTCAECSGYEYNHRTGRWYKFHEKAVTWTAGKAICEAEEAHLAVPNSEEEARILTSIHARYLDTDISGTEWPDWVSVGIYRESGSWVTVDGQPLSKAGYEKWLKGWPSGLDPFVVMNRGGKYSNTHSDIYPFICEKATATNCNKHSSTPAPELKPTTPRPLPLVVTPTEPTPPPCAESLGYEYSNKTGHWYKFYSKVANWTIARSICKAEGALLAVPNSNEEAKVLTTIHAAYLDAEILGTDWPDWVSVGIYWNSEAWTTVDGQPLAEAGYETWKEGWPDYMRSNPYLVMDRGGKFSNTYNDVYPFICEIAVSADCNDRSPVFGSTPVLPARPSFTPAPFTGPTNPTCEENLGYEYSKRTGHWYKFHWKVANWTTGKRICEEENALLAVPNSNEEAKVLTTIHARYLDAEIPGTRWPDWVSVGIYWKSGAWTTVDGQTLAEAGYEKWKEGWPDKIDSHLYVVMDRGGKFSNTENVPYPFICEKANASDCKKKTQNSSTTSGVKLTSPIPAFTSIPPTEPTTTKHLGYEYSNKTGHWYKFHSKVANWTTGRNICRKEGARLAVPNSIEEAKVLTALHARYLNAEILGTDWPDWVSVGIFKKSGSWITVDGQLLSDAGYEIWLKGWPKGSDPYVVMDRGGKYSNTRIDLYAFICEKTVE